MFHIYVADIEDWAHIPYFDVFHGYQSFYLFIDYDLVGTHVEKIDSFQSMVKVWYYALTTLSTIGYGDFLPKSVIEKLIVSGIMMMGVTVFSYIMGCLMNILLSYKQLDEKTSHKELAKWVALLSKFNSGTMLPRSLIRKIEDFFEFYWENNPLLPFSEEYEDLYS